MHCNYCGKFISTDDVVREQRVGFATDNVEGTPVEIARFVSTAACDCGSTTTYEFESTDELLELEAVHEEPRIIS